VHLKLEANALELGAPKHLKRVSCHFLLLFLLQHNEEGDGNNDVVTFFFLLCCSVTKKVTAATIVFFFLFIYKATKKAMTTKLSLPSFSFSFIQPSLLEQNENRRQLQHWYRRLLLFVLLQHNEEGDGNNIIVAFFCYNTKSDSNVDVITFYFCFIATKKAMMATLLSRYFCSIAA
jgi:hypothetical protein